MGLPATVTTTPKLDAAICEFGQRIADPAIFNSTGIIQDGIFLKKEDYATYINKAMLKLFNDTWITVRGDASAFLLIFPELYATSGALSFTKESVGSFGEAQLTYSIESPYCDFMKLVSANAYMSEKIRVIEESLLSVVATKSNCYYEASAEDMIIIPVGKKLYLFPPELESFQGIFMTYIKMPVNPNTGRFLTQAGDVDMPFTEQWISKIAELAEEFFRKEAQEES